MIEQMTKKHMKNYELITGIPKYGDLIFADRQEGIYRHFGIYAGNKTVIHFADPDDELDSSKAIVHEIALNKFIDECNVYRIKFPNEYTETAYSEDETVNRAKAQIGKKGVDNAGYNILFNNCEHFAVWCKTGISTSMQRKRFIQAVVTGIGKGYTRDGIRGAIIDTILAIIKF